MQSIQTSANLGKISQSEAKHMYFTIFMLEAWNAFALPVERVDSKTVQPKTLRKQYQMQKGYALVAIPKCEKTQWSRS